MRRLRDASLRRKVTAIVMITSLVALAMAATGFVVYDRISFRDGLVKERLRRYVATVVGVTAAASLVALLLLSPLQGIVSRPILDMVATAKRISDQKDFTVRASKYGDDEIGALVDAFNAMLDRVQQRDDEAREARTHAETANRAKSSFLANMSHELRTPLNGIIGYSEMLTEEAHDRGLEDLVPDLERIQTAGKHLLSLINDVLDLSKIE